VAKYLWIGPVVLALWLMFRGHDRMPLELLPQYTAGVQTSTTVVGGQCIKDRCLTVVVAPWCPSCRALNGMIISLRDQVEADGYPVNVVVAMDKPRALAQYAASYAKPVALDVDGKFWKQVKIKGVPYFAVTNSKGEIVEFINGGHPDVAVMRQRLGI
jgi:thiol-disulfide isomerase/thioredoxin